MKAVLLFGKRDARIVDLEVPKISENELLVKLLACGICGTDIEKYEGDFLTPPILGHEVVGIIEEIGSKVGDFKKGQKIFAHHHVPCRVCYYCLRGDFTLCERFTRVNFDPCGLAEFFRIPSEIIEKKGIFLLEDSFDIERATFIEPLACCIRALNKISPQVGDKVVIFGAGPAGLLMLLLLNEIYRTDTCVVEINELRLKMAEKLGAELLINPLNEDPVKSIKDWTKERGSDIIITATSNVEVIRQAIKSLRRGGKLCIFGSPKKNQEIALDFSYIFINEIKIIPSYSTTEFEISQALSLLERNILEPEKIITHRFKLEDAIQALEITRKGEAVKTIIKNV